MATGPSVRRQIHLHLVHNRVQTGSPLDEPSRFSLQDVKGEVHPGLTQPGEARSFEFMPRGQRAGFVFRRAAVEMVDAKVLVDGGGHEACDRRRSRSRRPQRRPPCWVHADAANAWTGPARRLLVSGWRPRHTARRGSPAKPAAVCCRTPRKRRGRPDRVLPRAFQPVPTSASHLGKCLSVRLKESFSCPCPYDRERAARRP